MMSQVASIPIYFSIYNGDLDQVIEDITSSSIESIKNTLSSEKIRESALSEILGSISANGYQIVVSGASHVANKQSKIPVIQGELAPLKNLKPTDAEINSKLPLIIVVAHLNTFGLYNVSNSFVKILIL